MSEEVRCPKCGKGFLYPAPPHRTLSWVMITAILVAGVYYILKILLENGILV